MRLGCRDLGIEHHMYKKHINGSRGMVTNGKLDEADIMTLFLAGPGRVRDTDMDCSAGQRTCRRP